MRPSTVPLSPGCCSSARVLVRRHRMHPRSLTLHLPFSPQIRSFSVVAVSRWSCHCSPSAFRSRHCPRRCALLCFRRPLRPSAARRPSSLRCMSLSARKPSKSTSQTYLVAAKTDNATDAALGKKSEARTRTVNSMRRSREHIKEGEKPVPSLIGFVCSVVCCVQRHVERGSQRR